MIYEDFTEYEGCPLFEIANTFVQQDIEEVVEDEHFLDGF